MMEFGEMRRRCSSSQFVTISNLPDHELRFTRRSKNRGCGVGDAFPQKGKQLWGVVYDIPEIEFGFLDDAEGFKPGRALADNAYVREQRHVCRDGDQDRLILVWLYFANRQSNPPLPNATYKKLIIDGAKFWHLPGSYQAELRQIKVD